MSEPAPHCALRRWLRAFYEDVNAVYQTRKKELINGKPLAQVRQVAFLIFILCGIGLLAVLVLPGYDRALVLTGRSEVVSMQLDDPDFGDLEFSNAVLRADLDKPASAPGKVRLTLRHGATVRIVRLGRGALRLSFTASPASTVDACPPGLHAVGTATAENATIPLCDAAVVVVALAAADDPVVIGLNGNLIVGEEPSQGVGSRPILLEATASLFVRHSGSVFRSACRREWLEHLCDRFVASSLMLAPGSSVRANYGHGEGGSAGRGFLRADPNEISSGLLFSLSAPAEAFMVSRIEGETYTVKENWFDVVQHSPLMHTLNTTLAAVGLIWYFLRLRRGDGEGSEKVAAVLLCALLAAPSPVVAQQAMLRADETGQAILRARGDRCYAITPSHVIGSETSALVTAPGRQQGEGDLLRRVPAAPEPIALLTLRGVSLSLCPAFEGAPSLDSLLRDRGAAVLRLVRSDGSIDRIPLLLTSVEIETIEVQAEKGTGLEQGMSGGTVLVGEQPVGLLVDVLDGGRTGRVARLDRVFERLTPHLRNAEPSFTAPPTSSDNVPYEVLRSNAAPVASANRVSNLFTGGLEPWRVEASGRVELTLKAAASFGAVSVDLSGITDPPATLEILGGRGEAGPWQSLTSIALEPGDKVLTRRVASGNLRYVLLRLQAALDRRTLAIAQIKLIAR